MIHSVEKAIGILAMFTYAHPCRGVSELAQALDLPKGTAHNLVKTLTAAGFLKQDPETRRYSLGPRLFTLGTIMAGTLEINQKAAGPAHALAAQSGLVCRVAIWDQDAALITLNLAPQYAEALAAQIGPRVAAYCSAIGRVFLAYMDNRDLESYLGAATLTAFTSRTLVSRSGLKRELKRIRERGYALNDQELAQGRTSLAVAIFGRSGRPEAALSLTGTPEQVLGKDQDRLISRLRGTAGEIGRYMGYFGS